MNIRLYHLRVFSSFFTNISAALVLTVPSINNSAVLIINLIFIIISLSLALKLEKAIYFYD
ncbi:hypothetical protein COS50_04255 [Candidatus Roizmanbacteria bacterium CG03_land_8_20_14_0_80_35_26]|uniref:Uncharacterized protein n=1 Tax=Candidatus Roizmanbacteria bacterium CG03_land_8_20_14_0_80_35_26 TaxID=1974845 RepID=A0A2M7BVT1_9BACT|nr:MAG: hypothetical protein COS50_04255 [Candidatus Roizmanbacteria bacterium CG03_land_8_20_14_0_80_35_26]PJC80262.1 MAG: hypothetical protein CO008_02380 [Candidatus Roizmanbacteria bacterium CG_4_8_14_3_um_filter_36_12]